MIAAINEIAAGMIVAINEISGGIMKHLTLITSVLCIICTCLFTIYLLSKTESVKIWLEQKHQHKGFELARNTDPDILRQVSKEYKNDYEVIIRLLYNEATPSDVIEYWITKGAWHYGLRQISFYGPMDENLRENILVACIRHPNVDILTMTKLAEDVLNNEKDYFIEHAYPEDDLHFITVLMMSGKISSTLQNRLNEYYKYRKEFGKTSTRCDENGFIKREYL